MKTITNDFWSLVGRCSGIALGRSGHSVFEPKEKNHVGNAQVDPGSQLPNHRSSL
jgi:hypothetical protein